MKKALLVGINYPGSANELRGCVNDANLINKVITEQYGFIDSEIRMLLDNAATTAAMLESLEWLIADAMPGDVIYFHYSGHGSQMRDLNGDEADGLDEIICPVDLNWKDKVIKDDQLKEIFDRVPNGVNLTISLDCCNSGTGLDQTNQYQPSGDAPADRAVALIPKEGRFLAPPEEIGLLENKIGFKPRAVQRKVDATGLLLTGCQAHQTSADAYINGGYIGAFTYVLVDTLKSAKYNINYKDLIDQVNKQLADYGFTQRPELNGPEVLFGRDFLTDDIDSITSGLDEPDAKPAEPVVKPVVAKPVLDDIKPDKKKKIGLIIAGVLAVAAVIYFSIQ